MDRLKWVKHNGKDILINDTSGLSADGFADQMRKFMEFVLEEKKDNMRVLSDIKGTSINTSAFNELKRIATITKPHMYKYAVVGVESAIHQVLFTAVKKFAVKYLESKKTIQEAMDWLAQD